MPWAVPRCWSGETVTLLGGGPSLNLPACRYAASRSRTIAINDAWKLMPDADMLYGCDAKWWRWHEGAIGFAGIKISHEPTPYDDVYRIDGKKQGGLSRDPSVLCLGASAGRSSGHQALNIATLTGAARIILLGFDMVDSARPSHWHGEHPGGVVPQSFEPFRASLASTVDDMRALGIEVWNCSSRTALTCFPRAELCDVL